MKDRRQAGFTLIELMFTVVVLAVLLGIGVPNFRDFIRNARITAAANDILTSTNLARSEAVKRGRPVAVCSRTANALTCDAGDFSDGWLIFVDEDGDGSVDAGDAVLDQRPELPDSIQTVDITSPGPDPDDPTKTVWAEVEVSEVIYGPNGFRVGPSGALPEAIAITFCDARMNAAVSTGTDALSAARSVDISVLGRTQVVREQAAIETREGCAE